MPLIRIEWPEAEMSAIIARARGDALGWASEFTQDLIQELVATTPVKTGFLRGSWKYGLNEIPSGVGSASADPGEGVEALAATLTIGDTIYIVNTAAYAARIEYGFFGRDSLGRNYSQPGRGWVRAVVNRATQIALAAAERVARRR